MSAPIATRIRCTIPPPGSGWKAHCGRRRNTGAGIVWAPATDRSLALDFRLPAAGRLCLRQASSTKSKASASSSVGIDHDVQLAVEFHFVFGGRPENEKSTSTFDGECPQFRHDEIGCGAALGGKP